LRHLSVITIPFLGRGIVEFLEDVFAHNIGEELQFNDDADIPTRLERAFLMTDIQSRMAGIMTSGATVALCLIKVCFTCIF
jgi:protein phosphatase/protein phosphatase PTC1